jgi:hypothetical protein
MYAVTKGMNVCAYAVASIVSESPFMMMQRQRSNIFNVISMQGWHGILMMCDKISPIGVLNCTGCRSTMLLVPYRRIMKWPRCRSSIAMLICR